MYGIIFHKYLQKIKMTKSNYFHLFLLYACIIFLFSCNTVEHNSVGIEAAMKKYDNLILKLDADSIALLFTPDGHLGNMAVGRDSIRKFFLTFKNIKVLSQSSTTDSIKITADSALQYGKYKQSDVIAEKDTVYVKGEYITKWQWIKKQGWQIHLIETKTIK